jgi:hypothetical protein
MATPTKKAPAPKPAEKSSLDYLQQALDDLDSAREQAQHEVGASIDAAVDRIRDARNDLTTRAHDEAGDLQSRLEHASEEVRREIGRTAIRAQRTPDALTAMQAEIRDRKRKLERVTCPPGAPPREHHGAARRAALPGRPPRSCPRRRATPTSSGTRSRSCGRCYAPGFARTCAGWGGSHRAGRSCWSATTRAATCPPTRLCSLPRSGAASAPSARSCSSSMTS